MKHLTLGDLLANKDTNWRVELETNDPFGLRGRICVVTGGGSGIGQGVAIELAAQGANVAVLDINEAGNQETLKLIEENGGKGIAVTCNVSEQSSVEAARDAIVQQFGDPEVLVNVAGIQRRAPFEEQTLEDWNRVLAVNLTGYFLCSQIFGAAMRAKGDGVLVHFSSVMADFPSPGTGAYSVTKAGVQMLSRQLAVEWGPKGIRSNCVAPAFVITPLSKKTYDIPGALERRSSAVPSRRIGLPTDMAKAVLFLVSPMSSYVNGTELLVDGGVRSNLMSLVPRPDLSTRD